MQGGDPPDQMLQIPFKSCIADEIRHNLLDQHRRKLYIDLVQSRLYTSQRINMTNDSSNSSASSLHSTASLVAGLTSIVVVVLFFVIPSWDSVALLIAALLGAAALVFGIIALRRRQAKAFAITGIITGSFSLLLSAAIYIFALLFIGAIAL